MFRKPPNIVYGTVNEIPTVLVVDTGADVLVFNKLFVEKHQNTGSVAEAISYNGEHTTYPIAEVPCTVGDKYFVLRGLVMEMGPEEGGLLGFNLDSKTMRDLLDLAEETALRTETQMNIRLTREEVKKHAKEDKRLAEKVLIKCPRPKDPDMYPDEEVRTAVDEAKPTIIEDDVSEREVEQEDASSSVESEVGESVCEEVVKSITGGSMRVEVVEAVKHDETLAKWKEYADDSEKGFFWEGGLIKKIVENELGVARYVIVVPKPFRARELKAAHDRMGHQSIKKVLPMVARNFSWPTCMRILTSTSNNA